MLKYFTDYVIGGDTGKRESAWFGFFIWFGFTAWLGRETYITPERPVEFLETVWSVTTPFVLTWLGAAHGLEWASSKTGLTATRTSYTQASYPTAAPAVYTETVQYPDEPVQYPVGPTEFTPVEVPAEPPVVSPNRIVPVAQRTHPATYRVKPKGDAAL